MITKGESNVKIIRSKRGFTIIEVLVAFVIFAIMAAMVSTILAQVNVARKQNMELETEIANQKQAYYLKDQDYEYKDSEKAGSLAFDFDGFGEFNINYSIGDPNAEDDPNQISLQYFIGELKYNMGGGSKADPSNPGNTPGSVTSRLLTSIYGTSGITQVTAKITRDKDYTGNGYRYYIKSMASFDGIDEQKWFAQYRFVFPSIILDYGYTQQSDSPNSIKSRFDPSTFQFEVYSPYNRTLRISSKQSSSETNPPAISNKYLYYYVVLTEPLEDIDPDLDMNKIFGYSSSEEISTKNPASGTFRFEPYELTTKNEETGEQTTYTYPNVFAAFPREEVEGSTSEATSES